MKKIIGLGGCEGNKEEVFQYAWDRGIRFFDSGFGYSGIGVNDKFLGDFLKDKKREEYQICNKLPLFDGLYQEEFKKSRFEMNDEELEFAIRKTLEIQLKRCGVEYFDIYMYHAIYDEQHQQDFDLERWTFEYKRIGKVLAKLKTEGLIKEIGFSSHVSFEKLYYFITEMENAFGKDFMKYAEVSYNILNDTGRPSKIAELYSVNVWPSAGLKGLKFLKEHNFMIIDMMPTESGRVKQISTAPDWFDWAYRFIRETNEIDMVLAGTSSVNHLNQFIDIFEEKDLQRIPDMRDIDSGIKHCHE